MSLSRDIAPPATPVGVSPPIPVNILVVDDHAGNRTALRAILSSPGYRIVEAGSGAEALLRLLEVEFAVLLIDVLMPGMNGFELAKVVKERERTAAVPIVFLTAQATDVELVYKGYRAGAVDYLIKPLVPEMVQAKVAVFADLYRERKRNEQQATHLLEAERKESEFRILELRLTGERRYRTLAEAVPHIVWTARPDGTVDYFNRRWFEYTELSVEQAAGSWLGIVHAEDVARCGGGWQASLGSGDMFQAECRLKRCDGSFRWHLCRAIPERSTTGQILSWLGTFTDIEEQKRVQAILAEFKATLDAEPDAVILFDPKASRILYVNQGASMLLGHSRDELLEMAPSDFVGEEGGCSLPELLAPLVDGSQPHVLLETTFRRKDARMSPVDVSVQLIRIGVDRIVSIARDITERKRAQLERDLLYREAVDAIRARDEFLSVASHELRTPLSALQLQIHTLLHPPRRAPQAVLSPEQVRAKLEVAYRQVERLTRLIGELMDVSRITAGRLRLEREETDLSAVVRDVVTRLSEEANRTKAHVDVGAATSVIGKWDRSRVEQVVTNLLTNAFKFGGDKPIEVTVEDGPSAGRLTVADRGIGIAPEDVARIFHRYEQATSSRAFGGLGLGLYIARQIVEAHGGTIRVESQPGAGSTFIVELPKEPPAERSPSAGEERERDDVSHGEVHPDR